MLDEHQALHFTGIGGAGMSGLAEIMHQLGYAVRGSDLRLTSVTERLAGLGIPVLPGHSAGNVAADAAAVVITSAVDAGNPELVEARRRGLPRSAARRTAGGTDARAARRGHRGQPRQDHDDHDAGRHLPARRARGPRSWWVAACPRSMAPTPGWARAT